MKFIAGLLVVVLLFFTAWGVGECLADLLETKEIGAIGWGVLSIASLNFARYLIKEFEE
jgi:hypothetical protein